MDNGLVCASQMLFLDEGVTFDQLASFVRCSVEYSGELAVSLARQKYPQVMAFVESEPTADDAEYKEMAIPDEEAVRAAGLLEGGAEPVDLGRVKAILEEQGATTMASDETVAVYTQAGHRMNYGLATANGRRGEFRFLYATSTVRLLEENPGAAAVGVDSLRAAANDTTHDVPFLNFEPTDDGESVVVTMPVDCTAGMTDRQMHYFSSTLQKALTPPMT